MTTDSQPDASVTGPVDPDCELCEAARFTHWYYEDDTCWVADCEVCDTPMVVWRWHGTEPGADQVDHMVERLSDAGATRFGEDGFHIDRVMRQIPSHFHAHARDPRWQARRWEQKPSLYTGVGTERETRP